MKRVKLIAVMGIAALVVAGCGSKQAGPETTAAGQKAGETSQTETQAEAGTEAKTETSKGEYEMVIALHTAPGTIENQAIERFKEKVEERTEGQVTVSIFPAPAGSRKGKHGTDYGRGNTGQYIRRRYDFTACS